MKKSHTLLKLREKRCKRERKEEGMAKKTRQDQFSEAKRLLQGVILNDVELMKELIQETLQRIVDTEFEKYIGVAPYERSDERRGYRNGYRDRNILTRLGRLEIRLPRDREGNFSTELFNRYQRSEKALLLALSESYFEGVSTWKVGKIMEKLYGEQFSRSTISNICKDLDKMLDSWRNRTLEKRYPYLVLDARYENVRESGIVRKKAVMIVLGIMREDIGRYYLWT